MCAKCYSTWSYITSNWNIILGKSEGKKYNRIQHLDKHDILFVRTFSNSNSPIDLSSLNNNMAWRVNYIWYCVYKMSFLINNLYTYKVINALFYMLRPLLYYQRRVWLLLPL